MTQTASAYGIKHAAADPHRSAENEMEPKEITVDGIPIVIRPMDTRYLMADREPNGVQVAVGCRVHVKHEQWPNPMGRTTA